MKQQLAMGRWFQIAAALALCLAGCSAGGGTRTFSYRTTITYAASGQTVTASGVLRVKLNYFSANFASGLAQHFTGEALGAFVPGIGHVFLLFGAPSLGGSRTVFSDACGVRPMNIDGPSDADVWLDRVEAAFNRPCEVKPQSWPPIVVFSDPNDPATAKAFVGTTPPGLSVISYTVEPTSEPPTFGTTNVLGWLKEEQGRPRSILVYAPSGKPVSRLSLTRPEFINDPTGEGVGTRN